LLALFFALRAAKPRPFNIAGNFLSQWTETELHGGLSVALMSQAEVYDGQILENIAVLTKNASRVSVALRLMAAAPTAAILTGTAFYFISRAAAA
jgi:hypothetical protein